jgi:hypothetical protein
LLNNFGDAYFSTGGMSKTSSLANTFIQSDLGDDFPAELLTKSPTKAPVQKKIRAQPSVVPTLLRAHAVLGIPELQRDPIVQILACISREGLAQSKEGRLKRSLQRTITESDNGNAKIAHDNEIALKGLKNVKRSMINLLPTRIKRVDYGSANWDQYPEFYLYLS